MPPTVSCPKVNNLRHVARVLVPSYLVSPLFCRNSALSFCKWDARQNPPASITVTGVILPFCS